MTKAVVRDKHLGNPACAGEGVLPDWAMDREYICWQPDELDHKEFNMVIVDDSDNVFLVKSIDFDFPVIRTIKEEKDFADELAREAAEDGGLESELPFDHFTMGNHLRKVIASENPMKYKIVAYIPVEVEPEEDTIYDSFGEAYDEKDNLELMQPENIYKLEVIEED